jgi:hypothetical protein
MAVALDLIADQLAQTPWTPDTLDQIADIVRAAGWTIGDDAELCDVCQCTLEPGQIGKCDGCQG